MTTHGQIPLAFDSERTLDDVSAGLEYRVRYPSGTCPQSLAVGPSPTFLRVCALEGIVGETA
jgi:hypothetical protein